ncbi:MAG: hypothetical protein ACREUW_06615 [Burkholderiales bacterium]
MKNTSGGTATIILAALVLLLSGCAGSVVNMREVPADRAVATPQPGKAMVVFMRPSGLGFAVQSSVYEVRGNEVALVGIVAAKTKLAYQSEPGNRLFMAVGESADFITANLQANKTYYVTVEPRMGLWKARFSLEPIGKGKLATAEFENDLKECKWVEKSEASDKWAADNMESIQSKRVEYYADWLKKPDNERLVLLAEDGR